jgi:hypothetical protein
MGSKTVDRTFFSIWHNGKMSKSEKTDPGPMCKKLLDDWWESTV